MLTSVANATLLANLAPIFVALAVWLLYGTRPTPLFLAGLAAAFALRYQSENFAALYHEAKSQLNALRSAPVSAKVCNGLCKVMLGEAI